MSIRVFHGLGEVHLHGVVLSIGNFDGVHLGHRAIIATAGRLARAAGTQAVALTFEPHPAVVLAPDRIPPTLTPLEEKVRQLEGAGADAVVIVASRPEFFESTAEDFVEQVILQRFEPVALVEGASFRFGRHRRGDVEMLRDAGRQNGFEVEIVEPIRVDLGGHPDTVISSSLVRHLLQSGTVDRAALCLGRPYALIGTVQPGAARGRTLGFATANLSPDPRQLTPPEGVYAGRAVVDGVTRPAAVSVGRTPTFDGTEQLVEAHLLDFSGDLYGRIMRLEFLAWVRHQRKFDSPADLQRQVVADIARIREVCSSASPAV